MSNLKEHLINPLQCNALNEEYQNQNYRAINTNRPSDKPDSRFYTYDLALFEEYLEYVKAEAEKKGISNVCIRVCMGQYPTSGFDQRLDRRYEGYQTIYFVGGNYNEAGEFNVMENIEGLDFGQLTPPAY